MKGSSGAQVFHSRPKDGGPTSDKQPVIGGMGCVLSGSFWIRLRSLTAGSPPFSSMNSMPAFSGAIHRPKSLVKAPGECWVLIAEAGAFVAQWKDLKQCSDPAVASRRCSSDPSAKATTYS
jgi:hypothetical protein